MPGNAGRREWRALAWPSGWWCCPRPGAERIGPGAISTAVIYAGEAGKLGFAGEAAGIGVIFAVAVSILASFWFAGLITRILGRVGTIIVIRVLGLILCAMAVQFIITAHADRPAC